VSGLNEHQIFYRRLLRKCPHIGAYNPDAALRLIHRRGDIHPDDVVVFVYRTRNAALLHSRSNREAYHHDILAAAFPVNGVWISIVSLRKWLRAHGPGPTDPAEPWTGWNHPGVWRRT
jgi:hypothetical protein